jgi:hypothetical protein
MLTNDPVYLVDQAGRFRCLAPAMFGAEERETILSLADECELREMAIHPSPAPADLTEHIALSENRLDADRLENAAQPKPGAAPGGPI